jgi:hypothetical protein
MNLDKFNRTKRFKKNFINGILEPDLVTNNISNFKFSRQKNYYTLTYSDLARPDIISLKLYGIMGYWWLLMKINNIENVWEDLQVGDVILVPDKKDMDDFIMSK